jgi:hypothetical protein
MWRRVPCEQPLHTGQSILSPRRNPMLMVAGCSCYHSGVKGVSFSHPFMLSESASVEGGRVACTLAVGNEITTPRSSKD